MPSSDKDTSVFQRASSYEELYSWNGREFVRRAYVTLLSRLPDSAGEGYYYGRLCAGYSKVHILEQLAASEEYASDRPVLPGLSSALKKYRRARNPILRWWYQIFGYTEGNGSNDRRWRMLLNEISSIRSEISNTGHYVEGIERSIQSYSKQGLSLSQSPIQKSGLGSEESSFSQTSNRHHAAIDTNSTDKPSAIDHASASSLRRTVVNVDLHPDLGSQARRVINIFQRNLNFEAVAE